MVQKTFHFLGNFCFYAVPFCAFIVVVVMISLHSVLGTIHPKTIDRSTLIRVMQIRDFRILPPKTVAELAERAEAEFGRNSLQKPVFQFSETEKNVYAYFQSNRQKEKQQQHPSYFETNLILMAKSRYFHWMNTYAAAAPEEQSVLMNEIVDDMNYWQTVYLDFLQAANLPVPSLAELIQEFDEMIEQFKVGATEDEIARIDHFKRRMNAAFVASEVHNATKNLSENVSSAVSNLLGTFSPLKKKESSKSSELSTDFQPDSQPSLPNPSPPQSKP
jgi:hypothetical protein